MSLALKTQFAFAEANSCGEYIQAFNEYTQKIDGKIVKKYSMFEVTDWSRNSRFQGLVLTAKTPADAEVVLLSQVNKKAKPIINKTKKTTVFTQDKKYRVVDLNLEKFLGSAPQGEGHFTLKVISGGKELCLEKKLIYDDGD